jgi:AraC-like DNA-binding protein
VNSKLHYVKNWPELARQANWSTSALAKLLGTSTSTLRRHFFQKNATTPNYWLADQRQHHALKLLRDGSSIKEVAASVGYKHQSNFTRKFKAFWGVCPSLCIAQFNSRCAKKINNAAQ